MNTARDVVRRYMQLCNTGDADAIAACFDVDAVIYDLNHPPVRGAEAIGSFWVKVRDRWEGATWSIVLDVTEGDHVAMEWEMTGRRDGDDVLFRGTDIITVRGDRISEIHQYWSFHPETGSTLIGLSA